MLNSPAFRASLLTVLETILGPDAEVTIEEDGAHVTIDYPSEPTMEQNRLPVHEALAMAAEMMRDRYTDDNV
jgi:hypothetical protein